MSDDNKRTTTTRTQADAPPPEAAPPIPEHVTLLKAQLDVCNALQGLRPDAQRKVMQAVAVTLGLGNGNAQRAANGSNARPPQQNNQQQGGRR